jgi:basic membrane protein A and related proteins
MSHSIIRSQLEEAITHAKLDLYVVPMVDEFQGEDVGNAFITTARSGISRAEIEFRSPVTVTRMTTMSDAASVIKKVADSGANPIILLGNQYVAPVMSLADRYPGSNFTIIDGLAPPLFPNVQSILFKDHEGAFLVGMIAGKISHTNLVGFVGGMDIPLIRNFALGFTQGVKYAAPDLAVDVQMVGPTAEAWSNPEKAKALAQMQYREGADIVFAAAGGSSLGVLQAANEMGKLAIGVDSNQNGLFPGHVLTSLVKRVDVAVYDTLKNSREGTWSAGIKYLGIKEGALDYAVDQNNSGLISEKLIEEVATAKDKIISGKIVVESYSAK